ncbi:MAG: hypothetical protein ACRD2L_07355 [Terriglobia bacterium]
MLYDFVKHIKTRLASRRAEYERELGKGSATSFDDYRKRVGKIEGLHEAEGMLEIELAKFKEDGD